MAILAQAQKVLAREVPVLAHELHDVRDYVVEYVVFCPLKFRTHYTCSFEENNMSVFQRVYGFFTFVNIVWTIAILGITISVGPAVWAITEPIRGLFS